MEGPHLEVLVRNLSLQLHPEVCLGLLWSVSNPFQFTYSTHREQKTINLENRGRYKALQERWVVLDKTISLPEEEPVCDPLEYLQPSDEEDITGKDCVEAERKSVEQIVGGNEQSFFPSQ